MRKLGKTRHHFQLISRMAKTTETDLVSAYDAGELSQRDWAGMVQGCRACGWSGDCASWMDDQDSAVDPPRTCVNRDRFLDLKHTNDDDEKA